jgi:peptide/nickel transport system substrate-binding protein
MQNRGVGYLDGIKYAWLPDQASRSVNLEAGDFDIIEQPAPQDVARLQANPDITVVKHPAISILYLGFNFKTEFLKDHAVREAIYRSIDRKIIIDKVMFGQAVAAYSPVPPTDAGYWKGAETIYPYDTAKAKSLLEGAGWKLNATSNVMEKNGIPLNLNMIVVSGSEQKTIAEVVQQQLAQVGIKVDLEVLDKGTHQKKLLDGSSAMHFFRYVYDSPIAVLKILFDTKFMVPNGANWSFYSNPEADKWFESFNTTPDAAKRIEAIQNVQQALVQDVAMVPIYNPLGIWAMRKWVKGWTENPYMIYGLHNDLWVTEASPRAKG